MAHNFSVLFASFPTSVGRILTVAAKRLLAPALLFSTVLLFYTTALADDQATDAPTTADLMNQLQQATADQLAAQERLLASAAITPSTLVSIPQILLAPAGHINEWSPAADVTAAMQRPTQRTAGPLVYNATCTVTRTTDNGQSNTLRWCMERSNPFDKISFDPTVFPASTPVTITLASPLPPITDNGLLLDGCSYNSNACTTGVILSGWSLPAGSGLVISNVVDVTINGLVISGFPDDGILIQGGAQQVLIGDEQGRGRNIIIGNGRNPSVTTGDDAEPAGIRIQGAGTAYNLVLGNWIGIGADGQTAQGNQNGIQILNGATHNRIGGVTTAQRNLISGNLKRGIYIANNSHRNLVLGNWIGVDAQGKQAVANRSGIVVAAGSQENQIGDMTTGAGNLISGNERINISIESGSERNRIWGNRVGVDASGTYTVGATIIGVNIVDASNNQIGGPEVGARNLIASHAIGVNIRGGQATGNSVQGNWIGVDVNGQQALPNDSGVSISGGSSANLIGGEVMGAGNLISGNRLNGIEISDSATKDNVVMGNWIGVTGTGQQALGNDATGIFFNGVSNNRIGGGTSAARNLISGNGVGIILQGPGSNHNQILGNWIGVDNTGTGTLGNRSVAIVLLEGPQYNIIGGATAGMGNLISGNDGDGIVIQGADSQYNQVLGNFIGSDSTSEKPLRNRGTGIILRSASHNQIGGAAAGMGNLISGNHTGINVNSGSTENKIQGNKIGVNVTGTSVITNVFGVGIADSPNNWIGGSGPNEGNLISGNDGIGIAISGVGSTANRVMGNWIGVDSTGQTSSGVQSGGINLFDGANGNLIGSEEAGAGNVISGNSGFGVFIAGRTTTGNRIMGNIIGLDSTGSRIPGAQLGGISISAGASGNFVGGSTEGVRNVISGNGNFGVVLADSGTSKNQIQGNYIGVDRTGKLAIGNVLGIFIAGQASDNLIGGVQAGEQNVISGNTQHGIVLFHTGTMQNKIQGNLIGTDADGATAVGNQVGIALQDGPSQNLLENNQISGNREFGVRLFGAGTAYNELKGNAIGVNMAATTVISNGIWGILIDLGASKNLIGGTGEHEANIIGGNGAVGIVINGDATTNNQVIGNLIGTNATGEQAFGNGQPSDLYKANGSGIVLENSRNNEIADNRIAGHQRHGLYIVGNAAQFNHVHHNWIGLSTRDQPLPNQGAGIWLDEAPANRIGISNTIAFNLGSGIVISGTNLAGNTLTRNLIYSNGGDAIEWRPPIVVIDPRIQSYDSATHTLRGRACPGCIVEVYGTARKQAEAQRYLGDTVADAQGDFTLTLAAPPILPHVAALVTRPSPDGTTLPWAQVFAVGVRLYLPVVQR